MVSGIAQYYSPEEIEGKTLILVANLKPARIRGIESRMILAATDETEGRANPWSLLTRIYPPDQSELILMIDSHAHYDDGRFDADRMISSARLLKLR